MSLPVPSAHASSSLSWCAKSRPESAGELLEGAERSWGCCGLDAAPTWLSHPTFLSLRHPPCSSGQQCQELIRNLKAAAEPGALALGAGGGHGRLASAWGRGCSASACGYWFPGVPSSVLWSPRCSRVLPRPLGMLVVQRLAVGSGLGTRTPVTAA